MARKRMIDPEFWSDEEIGQWSHSARLFYIGLWNFADDEGRFKAHSSLLKSQIFPYDDKINLNNLKKEISNKIKWYSSGSLQYGFIKNFLKYQKIDHPSDSKLPDPDKFGEDSVKVQGRLVHNIREVNIREVKRSKDIADQGSAQSGKKKKEINPYLQKVIDHICLTWQNRPSNIYKSKYHFTGKHAKLISDLCRLYESHNVMALWDLYLQSKEDFYKTCGFSIEVFSTSMPKLLDQPYKSVSRKYEKLLYPGEDQSGSVLSKLDIDIKRIK